MKISPFQVARIFGQRQTKKYIDGYMDRRVKTDTPQMKQAVSDYIYHLFMRDSTSEHGILVLFNRGGQALLPLGT